MPQTMTVPTPEEIRTALAMGALDEHLGDLADLIRERQKQTAVFRFQVGDVVTFGKGVRPAYLHGTLWIIEKINQTTANMRTAEGQPPVGKFGTWIRGHLTSLQKVEV